MRHHDHRNLAKSKFDGTGQPRFSKDTIAEFEVITNRFDARQGRSTGIQVNAITKSGTNTPAGSFAGYFRDDQFNAADFIQKKVLPYSDQQLSATFGGPIKKDRIHYFLNYEYERSPYTRPYMTPYPAFNINLQGTYTEKKGGGRLDIQFSPKTHFIYRQNLRALVGSCTTHGGPAAARFIPRRRARCRRPPTTSRPG